MASLLYGAGLRLRECLKLRVKDVDFDYRQILGRDAKGGKDRVTMLPQSVIEPMQKHLARVKALHERDVSSGHGDVELPDAIARKYPRVPYECGWRLVFPSHKLSVDPKTGVIRRHHVFVNYLIRGVKEAASTARSMLCGTRSVPVPRATPRRARRSSRRAWAAGGAWRRGRRRRSAARAWGLRHTGARCWRRRRRGR